MSAGRFSWLRRWLAEPALQGVAHLATAVTALVTMIALGFAASELRISAEQGKEEALLQREIAANASWERYMEMASARPEFAAGLDYSRAPLPTRTAYRWFVGRMLFAGEQILGFAPNDRQWKHTIQIEARAHKPFLESGDFITETYCVYTVQLRTTVIEAFADDDRVLSDKMAARHSQCLAEGYTE